MVRQRVSREETGEAEERIRIMLNEHVDNFYPTRYGVKNAYLKGVVRTAVNQGAITTRQKKAVDMIWERYSAMRRYVESLDGEGIRQEAIEVLEELREKAIQFRGNSPHIGWRMRPLDDNIALIAGTGNYFDTVFFSASDGILRALVNTHADIGDLEQKLKTVEGKVGDLNQRTGYRDFIGTPSSPAAGNHDIGPLTGEYRYR
ncbi:hypothetical protein HYV80_04005 [Candidatus Woesearchaeota archaeon]|nr:hypothetical protein [Candidatus Woesearchaeota archaeon]